MEEKKEMPGNWLITKILIHYGSKDFVKKFADGGFSFQKEIVDEWREVYMNGVGLVAINEFFDYIKSITSEYEEKFKDTPFDLVCSYVIPLCAPKFIEDVNTTEELHNEPTESK